MLNQFCKSQEIAIASLRRRSITSICSIERLCTLKSSSKVFLAVNRRRIPGNVKTFSSGSNKDSNAGGWKIMKAPILFGVGFYAGVVILRPEQAARHENDVDDNNWTSSSKHLSELKRDFVQSSERSSSKYDSK